MVKAGHGQGRSWSRPFMVKAVHGQGRSWPRPVMVKSDQGQGRSWSKPIRVKAVHGQGRSGSRPVRVKADCSNRKLRGLTFRGHLRRWTFFGAKVSPAFIGRGRSGSNRKLQWLTFQGHSWISSGTWIRFLSFEGQGRCWVHFWSLEFRYYCCYSNFFK